MGREKCAQIVSAEACDALGRAKDRPANRLIWKGCVLEELVGDLVRAVARGGDLLQDHLPLALKLILGVARYLQDVGQDVEGDGDVALENACEVGSGLQAGGGIELAADRFNLLGDIGRAAPLGALKRHVLQQMGDAVLARLLMAGARGHPHAERHRLQMRHVVGDHAQAVQQARRLRAHAATPDLFFADLRPARSSTKRWTAPRSLRSTVTRSRSLITDASRGGRAGRAPVIASIVSGNLAGWAVASATCGISRDGFVMTVRAATTAQALWG